MEKSNRFYSSRQEKKIAKIVDGRMVPNSGATPLMKGDVTTSRLLIEAKTTVRPQKSFSIQKAWIEKLREESLAFGKVGVLAFDFGENGTQFFVLQEDDFKQMYQAWLSQQE